MRKTAAGAVLVAGLTIGLMTSPISTWAQGVVSSIYPVAATYFSSAPNGSNGFACKVDGCRVDLGSGASDYWASNGISITTPTNVIATGYLSGASVNAPVVRFTPASALVTCAVGYEGRVQWLTSTGGTNSGSQTRLCVCVSDGAASPTYSWRNLISGTAGNATTCNP